MCRTRTSSFRRDRSAATTGLRRARSEWSQSATRWSEKVKVKDLPPGRLHSVDPRTSLADVARLMRRQDADSVAVMSDGRLVGIVTERALIRAIAAGLNPQQTGAEVIMSADPAPETAQEVVDVVVGQM